MNVSIGDRWESYIEALLKEGRYGSASEIVREGLRLVEEREQKLAALRETIEASIVSRSASSFCSRSSTRRSPSRTISLAEPYRPSLRSASI